MEILLEVEKNAIIKNIYLFCFQGCCLLVCLFVLSYLVDFFFAASLFKCIIPGFLLFSVPRGRCAVTSWPIGAASAAPPVN